jgi:sterol desaturase/sphingolipid hydroxylase (fatty acid hydroxylase superfamily)
MAVLQLLPQPPQWQALTSALRWLTAVVVVTHLLGVVQYDTLVEAFWRWTLDQSWSRWVMLEALVAGFSFLMWILWFRNLDSLPMLQCFRFVQRPAAPYGHKLRELKSAWGDVCSPTKQHGKVLRTSASLPIYLLSVALLHLVRMPRPVQTEAPSFTRLACELAVGIWAYDFIFYWLHLFMHRFHWLPHGHNLHHEHSERCGSKFLEAEAVVNHSLVDGALQVIVNIFVQNLTIYGLPKHKLSRLLHNVVVTYLLTESHAGLDLPWASHRVFPELFGGAWRHEIHHQYHRCCFHQFFTYLDDLLGYGPPSREGFRSEALGEHKQA